MANITKGLIAVSALAFVLAVVAQLFGSGQLAGVNAEGFSRACTNLALLAIAMSLCMGSQSAAPVGE